MKQLLVFKSFCFQKVAFYLPQQENKMTKYYKLGPVSNHGEIKWGDHLTVFVCWKHQLMTFITNDLDSQAMNPDNTD